MTTFDKNKVSALKTLVEHPDCTVHAALADAGLFHEQLINDKEEFVRAVLTDRLCHK